MTFTFKNELARKFVHFLSLFIILVYFLASDFFSEKIALIILVLILIILLEFEYLRIELGNKIPILSKIWSYMRRKKEKDKLGGDIFFVIGAILVLAVFDLRIAIAAILMTTLGDLSAALIGKKFGKHPLLKTKSWEGTIAEFIVNIIIGISVFIIYTGTSFANWQAWTIILVMALTATFVETVVNKLDDNLLIPVFAGFNGQIAFLILSYI
ncbi:MAG: SEC59/DGK1/VTE5 family protein [Nanoarchaeota archaeon]|nr:SEC59/DGK1/VTE5 family protein [Nanoarchaeota archaeon]MBU1051871.1 SEC59/DGK1/VTE5 family protein [Nanoarchaeota archaeon]MBU1988993.1 SEC59/DGK1/VTE5 family protein [Nanoarchaeota archaeon]